MKQFIAVIHKDPGSAYGMHFPDVPGCFSAADEEKDILANAVEALALHLGGEDIPEARSLEALREEVKEDIAEGAFLLAVPYVNTVGLQTRVNISIDAGVLKAIDDFAADRNLTRSAFLVRSALNEIEGRH